jgi:hypothetical protein
MGIFPHRSKLYVALAINLLKNLDLERYIFTLPAPQIGQNKFILGFIAKVCLHR